MFEVGKTWAGAQEILTTTHEDLRGDFTKCFHHEAFSGLEMNTTWKEQYISTSKPGVIRGLHFQTPPMDHDKFVMCLSGQVIDLVVDLRKGSSTYGKCHSFDLSGKKKNGVYIPKGFAHGFAATGNEDATLLYFTSTLYSPENDSGILWNSVDFDWPVKDPILSDRDKSFVSLNEFQSPFEGQG